MPTMDQDLTRIIELVDMEAALPAPGTLDRVVYDATPAFRPLQDEYNEIRWRLVPALLPFIRRTAKAGLLTVYLDAEDEKHIGMADYLNAHYYNAEFVVGDVEDTGLIRLTAGEWIAHEHAGTRALAALMEKET